VYDVVNYVCMEYELPLSRALSSVSYPDVGCGYTPTLYPLKYSVYAVYVCKLGPSENLYGKKKKEWCIYCTDIQC